MGLLYKTKLKEFQEVVYSIIYGEDTSLFINVAKGRLSVCGK